MAGAVGLPFLPLWMRRELVPIPLFVAAVVLCFAASLGLEVGTWKYQRWEARALTDWGFIQWGGFLVGGIVGAVVMIVLLLLPRSAV